MGTDRMAWRDKRRLILPLAVLVACALAASYVIHLIVSQQRARMSSHDKELLSYWWLVLLHYSEFQNLSNRTDAALEWAQAVTEMAEMPPRFRFRLRIDASDCPAWLTPMQAEITRDFAFCGSESREWETEKKRKFTWKDALTGRFPFYDKKPSECLNEHFLDRFAQETCVFNTFDRPSPAYVIKHRDDFLRLSHNRKLMELIDECWKIGYQAAKNQEK